MSAGAARLPDPAFGLLLDRTKRVTFTFDGTRVPAFAGDVIASALYAEGRTLISRSFKYHRPRGVLTMAGHDSNALVQVADEPHVRADRQTVAAGMAVKSLNHLGSLDHDLMAGMGFFSRFLPVGFYYKTFFRPAGAWHYFERPIRWAAGLGRLEPKAKHRYYDKAYLFADVLVVGGGPAGLEAAIAAAEAGAEVILADEWPALGGSLLHGRGAAGRAETVARRTALIERAQSLPNLKIMSDTVISGLFSDNWASAICGNRLFKIRSRHTIVAAGAFDQPLVFANNDLPGILFADAAQRLMRLYAVMPGTRAVVVTSNRFGYEAALDLREAGVEVAAIVDLNRDPDASSADAAYEAGIRVVAGSTVAAARGRHRIAAAGIARLGADGSAGRIADWIDCDLLVMSVGYSPSVNLASHAGARVVYDPAINMHRARDLPAGLSVTGSAAGIWSDGIVRDHARTAGRRAASLALGLSASQPADATDPGAETVTHPFPIFAHADGATGKDFIDFDEDLSTDDIRNTIKDGYDDIQLVKRYSTVGLGLSQGRHANLNTIRVVARATKKPAEEIGTTTFRPPLVPEKFAHLAGRAFEPARLTAMHHRHLELGAQMMVAGLWMRPAYYGRKDEAARAIQREVRAVRENAGLIDVSTLGGLEVRGPDAAAFMDRMYTWAYAKQPIDRARYALMADDAGVLIDDGVACRLHQNHYYVTATTSAVDQVYRNMTWFNAQWQMDVDVANVTAAFAGLNLAGPKSRDIITKLDTDIDFSKEAFPYMGARTGHIAGIPVRILRVGFVGELGYEIHCPSSMGEALWDAIYEAGKPFGLVPFGVEAQRILRLEKGHIIVGQDTDGLTHPGEAGFEWALGKNKRDYIGKRSIDMQMKKGASRKLVGFHLLDSGSPEPKECHLVIRDGEIVGRITSVARSPTLGKVVGLVYLPPKLSEAGTGFDIRVDGGKMVAAEVIPTPFYDPENKRQEL